MPSFPSSVQAWSVSRPVCNKLSVSHILWLTLRLSILNSKKKQAQEFWHLKSQDVSFADILKIISPAPQFTDYKTEFQEGQVLIKVIELVTQIIVYVA